MNTKVGFQKMERQMSETRYLAKISRIQEHHKSTVEAINERNLIKGIEDKRHVQNRFARLQAYEEVYKDVLMA